MTVSDEDEAKRKSAARKALRFAAITTAVVVAGVIGLAALSRFGALGAGFHLNFALVLGVAGTTLLGVSLMALSFYSSRSGRDDEQKP